VTEGEPKRPPVTSSPGEPRATTPGEKKPAANEHLSMSELLDHAGAARRSGDYAGARGFYEKILKDNPANVEANGGLGDVARATGDLAAAKASYEHALASSPGYGPAALGLADVEWDLGDKTTAQKHYAQIVERQGDRAPARARERSGASTSAPTPAPAPE